MGRVLTDDKKTAILTARKSLPDALGPMLGELLLAGNIPVAFVADTLSVSEPTIYRWMYGTSTPTDKDKIQKIKRLLTVLRKSARAHDTPLVGTTPKRISAAMELLVKHKPVDRSE